MRLPVWILCSLTLGCTACQFSPEGRDIRNYYFPLRSLTDGLVYEYRPVRNDSLPPEYWYYRSLLPGDSVFLSATFYERDLLPRQQMTQKMTGQGMILKDLYLYEPDSTRDDVQLQIPVQVVADDVFPFRVRDNGGVFVYHIHWTPPQDPDATIRLIRNRRYVGDTTYTFKGERYPAVRFSIRELLEYDANGVFEQEYDGEEIYAKELGLVYYRKTISDALELEYALEDRYSMEQLETKFRSLYGIEAEADPDQRISPN